jgi:hypothetical protein
MLLPESFLPKIALIQRLEVTLKIPVSIFLPRQGNAIFQTI